MRFAIALENPEPNEAAAASAPLQSRLGWASRSAGDVGRRGLGLAGGTGDGLALVALAFMPFREKGAALDPSHCATGIQRRREQPRRLPNLQTCPPTVVRISGTRATWSGRELDVRRGFRSRTRSNRGEPGTVATESLMVRPFWAPDSRCSRVSGADKLRR